MPLSAQQLETSEAFHDALKRKAADDNVAAELAEVEKTLKTSRDSMLKSFYSIASGWNNQQQLVAGLAQMFMGCAQYIDAALQRAAMGVENTTESDTSPPDPTAAYLAGRQTSKPTPAGP